MTCVLTSAALLLAASAPAASQIELVSAGKPKATIVLRAQAPAEGPERTAVQELQHFIRMMSGAEVPVATTGEVVEGAKIALRLVPGAPHPRHDGYWLHVQDGDVLIEATHPRGLLFGAYGLLRQLGCRWYAPTDIGVIIPKRETLSLPADLDERREPDFARRYPAAGGPAETARMGYSYTSRARTPELLAEASARDLGTWRWGHIWPALVTNQYYADGRKATKMDLSGREQWLPMNKDGQRAANGQTLCFSNPDALRWFVDNAANWVLTNCANEDYVSMWSADTGAVALCQCDRCRRADWNATDWYVTLHNEIRKFLAERDWRGRFGWIVYHGSRDRPQQVQLHDHGEGMDLLYAPRRRGGTREGPFTNDSAASREYRALLAAWLEYLRENDYRGTKTVFEYYYDLVLLGPLAAGRTFLIPWHDVMQEDIRFYRDKGFDGFYDCSPPAAVWWPDPLSKWLYAELLWDADLDLESAGADFFANYYGPAAQVMQRARETVEACMRGEPSQESLEMLRHLDATFDEALRLAGGDAMLQTRIKAARLHAQYCALCLESDVAQKVMGDKARAADVERSIRDFLREHGDFLVRSGCFGGPGNLDLPRDRCVQRRLSALGFRK